MKKILLGFTFLLIQNLNAENCGLDESKSVVEQLIKNEIKCGATIKEETQCFINAKELFSKKQMKKSGIEKIRDSKYKVEFYRIEGYKITNIKNDEKYISFSVELYNYSNHWYKDAQVRVIKEDGECLILPASIGKGGSMNPDGLVIYPYYNLIHKNI